MDIRRRPWITGPGGLGAVGGLILFLLHGLAGAPAASPPVPSPAPSGTVGAEATHRVFLPLVLRSICAPIPGVTYEVFPVINRSLSTWRTTRTTTCCSWGMCR
jgi:hypothetical protein